MSNKGLVAMVTPVPNAYTNSTNIFSQPTSTPCPYMLALARPYILGAEITNFVVQFGQVKQQGDVEYFEALINRNVNLTAQEIATWGTNDENCYTIIAQKIGVTCTSFKEVNLGV